MDDGPGPAYPEMSPSTQPPMNDYDSVYVQIFSGLNGLFPLSIVHLHTERRGLQKALAVWTVYLFLPLAIFFCFLHGTMCPRRGLQRKGKRKRIGFLSPRNKTDLPMSLLRFFLHPLFPLRLQGGTQNTKQGKATSNDHCDAKTGTYTFLFVYLPSLSTAMNGGCERRADED